MQLPVAEVDHILTAVYAEGDPIIWLRCDLYRTARRAKQVAWSGEGIPYGFREDNARLKDLRVRRVWMRNDGAQNGCDEWWTQVSVTDVADLTEFFRVEPASNTTSAERSSPDPSRGAPSETDLGGDIRRPSGGGTE